MAADSKVKNNNCGLALGRIGRRAAMLALAVLAAAIAAETASAGNPELYAQYPPPPYAFPYPRPSVRSSPHLKKPKHYTLHKQYCPGRWVWLMPSYHEILPSHRGYYDNYFQLQFLRDY